jgi:fatty-acyl-CoA synthase
MKGLIMEYPLGQLTAREILDYLTPRVAKWWLPDEVIFIEAVPKTSVGKFDKKVLRERFKSWKPAPSHPG